MHSAKIKRSLCSLNIYINILPSVPFAASLVNGVWLQKQYEQALEVAVSEGVVKAMMTLVGAVGCLFGICQVEYSDCVKKSSSALLLGSGTGCLDGTCLTSNVCEGSQVIFGDCLVEWHRRTSDVTFTSKDVCII